MRIKSLTLKIIIMSTLIFHIAFVSIDKNFFPYYGKIQQLLIIIFGFQLLLYLKVFLIRKYQKYNIVLIILVAVMLFSSYINRNSYGGSIIKTAIFALQIVEVSLFCEYLNYKRQTKIGLNVLYLLSFLYCILSDILMIVSPHRITSSWGAYSDNFLVGNKFDLSYLHLLCIVLYCSTHEKKIKKNKIPLIMLIILATVVSVYSECSTGIVAMALFIIFLALKRILQGVSRKPIFTLIYITICNTLLFANSSIVRIPIIKYIIENILHESIELTGRISIYSKVKNILSINPMWGVGYDNNYFVSLKYLGAADIQNGILDCVVSFGIIGTILFLGLVITAIKEGASKSSSFFNIYLYIYISLSMVEITFRREFFVAMALLAFGGWNICNEKKTIHAQLEGGEGR